MLNKMRKEKNEKKNFKWKMLQKNCAHEDEMDDEMYFLNTISNFHPFDRANGNEIN